MKPCETGSPILAELIKISSDTPPAVIIWPGIPILKIPALNPVPTAIPPKVNMTTNNKVS